MDLDDDMDEGQVLQGWRRSYVPAKPVVLERTDTAQAQFDALTAEGTVVPTVAWPDEASKTDSQRRAAVMNEFFKGFWPAPEALPDGVVVRTAWDDNSGNTPQRPHEVPDSGNPKDAIGDTKSPLHLVPSALGIYAAEAMANGAAKYGPFNWREKKVRAHVYYAAILRHLAAWYDGENDAADSGAHHLGHAAAGLAILLDAMATGNLIDDRPTPGAAAALIEDFTKTKAP